MLACPLTPIHAPMPLFDLADVATVRGGLVVVEEVYRHPAMVSNSRPLPLSVRFRSIVPQPPSMAVTDTAESRGCCGGKDGE